MIGKAWSEEDLERKTEVILCQDGGRQVNEVNEAKGLAVEKSLQLTELQNWCQILECFSKKAELEPED
jgi:hypothetical protein